MLSAADQLAVFIASFKLVEIFSISLTIVGFLDGSPRWGIIPRNRESNGRTITPNCISCCTRPFPKDLLPTMVPLSLSCKAPATISLAEAEAAFDQDKDVSVFEVTFSRGKGLVYFAFLVLGEKRSICPSSKNSSTIWLATCMYPPGLCLKSRTSFFIPSSRKSVKADLNSS